MKLALPRSPLTWALVALVLYLLFPRYDYQQVQGMGLTYLRQDRWTGRAVVGRMSRAGGGEWRPLSQGEQPWLDFR